MPQKSNDRDEFAATPVPQEQDDELEMADEDDEEFEDGEDLDEEEGEEEDVEE